MLPRKKAALADILFSDDFAGANPGPKFLPDRDLVTT
jgi:hypothetical protein